MPVYITVSFNVTNIISHPIVSIRGIDCTVNSWELFVSHPLFLLTEAYCGYGSVQNISCRTHFIMWKYILS